MYSNSYCSYKFAPKQEKIGQSSHKEYSNNILKYLEFTAIINACTKKVWKLIECTSYQLNTSRYISKNNHYLIITTGTVSLPASLLVVSMSKAFNGMPPFLCGKQVVEPSSLPVVVTQCDERHANRA